MQAMQKIGYYTPPGTDTPAGIIFLKRIRQPGAYAEQARQAIRIMLRQVETRGAAKAFDFKYAGHTWRFEPVASAEVTQASAELEAAIAADAEAVSLD